MALEHIKTRREDRIITLYQVDPGFYEKILSRSSSMGYSKRRNISFSFSPGEVPFFWEMQPGKPIDAGNKIEILPPIRLPPAVHGLNMPKPRVRHSGPKDFISKHINKAKKIRSMKFKLPPAVRSLSSPEIPHKRAKKCFSKGLEKVKKIKNIQIPKMIKNIHLGNNSANTKSKEKAVDPFLIYLGNRSRAKSMETNGGGYGSSTDESEGFKSCSFESDDFTPSPTTTSVSSPSSWQSSFSTYSFSRALKSPKNILRFWSSSKELMKREMSMY